jgi:hypothetical protein
VAHQLGDPLFEKGKIGSYGRHQAKEDLGIRIEFVEGLEVFVAHCRLADRESTGSP